MQFQLVLQFRGDARAYFDRCDDPAARLATTLGDEAILDGEDVGPHGANLFLFTSDARASLMRALSVFPEAQSALGFVAAYRPVSGETFRVLWPKGAAEFSLR